ncbi:hypothetical protein H8Z72_22480 (plasmid) [Xanthomonas citri pv. citri]|uniref:hypothetical protein n=1 Tax=Xanthomonas citri TaxID=346 RepID=UPI0019328E64|nr:hypothetical protein [Xanthomonas citri]QRD62703.1 hypothetical protein H8Z74_22600 [Xanthomonas citri pv. citri]QRD67030.1 hypothetical protein H8Z73_22685 [Xanthomonas citri pv. citri]QRD71717.1 hypothetical protein H8Z72_22480 [Xanthomonas citri pv. citri]
MRYTFSLELDITDPDAFAHAAQQRAVAEETCSSVEEAAQHYHVGAMEACVVMLLDPGRSPNGSEIEHSSAEATC